MANVTEFPLIVYHVSPGNSASIKQSLVNRRIQEQLSSMMFKQNRVCVCVLLLSILVQRHPMCQTRVQSLNYGKERLPTQ